MPVTFKINIHLRKSALRTKKKNIENKRNLKEISSNIVNCELNRRV